MDNCKCYSCGEEMDSCEVNPYGILVCEECSEGEEEDYERATMFADSMRQFNKLFGAG